MINNYYKMQDNSRYKNRQGQNEDDIDKFMNLSSDGSSSDDNNDEGNDTL